MNSAVYILHYKPYKVNGYISTNTFKIQLHSLKMQLKMKKYPVSFKIKII